MKSKKIIFIHIPKTGGTSINQLLTDTVKNCDIVTSEQSRFRKALNKITGNKNFKKHESALELLNKLGEDNFNSLFSFAVVRNPYDWLVSYYFFITETKISPDTNKRWSHHLYPLVKDMTFKDFVSWVCDQNGLSNLASRKSLVFDNSKKVLQKDWVSNLDGSLLVKRILNVEELQTQVPLLLNELGLNNSKLPHINSSKRGIYVDYYDEVTKNKVYEYFKEDFDAFGYARD
ncbi:sulfotransferase family 2 domain-containing protein [Pseudoalteromonas sp. ZZD1]|uniref:sulfotransferase family 2 domain-containing protein n=1 Tax=Pseudoalteromonas sp. ZZD1 TaxID=3139395 RepID=UPI003BAB27D5